MKGIEINILYHNIDTRKNRDMGIEFDWRELEVRPFYLVNFDGAHPTYNNDNEYLSRIPKFTLEVPLLLLF